MAFFCIGVAGLLALDGEPGAPAFQPSAPPDEAARAASPEPAPSAESVASPAAAPSPDPNAPPVPVAARSLSSVMRPESAWRERNRLLESLIGALTASSESPAAATIELVPFGAGVALPAAPALGKKLVEVRHKLYPAPPKLSSPRLGFSSLAQAAGDE